MPALATPSDRCRVWLQQLDNFSTSQFVQQQTGEIRALMKRNGSRYYRLGQKLREGKWGWAFWRLAPCWIRGVYRPGLCVSERLYMLIWRIWISHHHAFLRFSRTATPQAARDEALARAASGETITRLRCLLPEVRLSSTKPTARIRTSIASMSHHQHKCHF